MTTSEKRRRLIEAAVDLFTEQGIQATSLADIAKRSDVPLGNVYYYFKTKDDLARAVFAHRAWEIDQLTENLDRYASPAERVKAFLAFVAHHADGYTRNGCPIGRLCQEMNMATPLSDEVARLFGAVLNWLEGQFRQLGAADSRRQAVHLLGAVQGAILLAKTFRDESLLKAEMERLAAAV